MSILFSNKSLKFQKPYHFIHIKRLYAHEHQKQIFTESKKCILFCSRGQKEGLNDDSPTQQMPYYSEQSTLKLGDSSVSKSSSSQKGNLKLTQIRQRLFWNFCTSYLGSRHRRNLSGSAPDATSDLSAIMTQSTVLQTSVADNLRSSSYLSAETGQVQRVQSMSDLRSEGLKKPSKMHNLI